MKINIADGIPSHAYKQKVFGSNVSRDWYSASFCFPWLLLLLTFLCFSGFKCFCSSAWFILLFCSYAFFCFSCLVFLWHCSPARAMASSFTRFRDRTQRRATVCRTPLDEWSARCRDLYLTTCTTDKYPYPRWDSNPRSQQASGLRPRGYSDRHCIVNNNNNNNNKPFPEELVSVYILTFYFAMRVLWL
jgi:hypothetical protein